MPNRLKPDPNVPPEVAAQLQAVLDSPYTTAAHANETIGLIYTLAESGHRLTVKMSLPRESRDGGWLMHSVVVPALGRTDRRDDGFIRIWPDVPGQLSSFESVFSTHAVARALLYANRLEL